MDSISDELEWLDNLDARYTQFDKLHPQTKQSRDKITSIDEPDTTQTITVNRNTVRTKQKNNNLREVDIDCIIIQETLEEQRQPKPISRGPENGKTENTDTPITTYRMNGNSKQGVKENTLRVGKLDVTKIEERNKEFKIMEEESRMYQAKKVY